MSEYTGNFFCYCFQISTLMLTFLGSKIFQVVFSKLYKAKQSLEKLLQLTSLICLYCCSFHSGLALRQFMKNCFTLISRSSILSGNTRKRQKFTHTGIKSMIQYAVNHHYTYWNTSSKTLIHVTLLCKFNKISNNTNCCWLFASKLLSGVELGQWLIPDIKTYQTCGWCKTKKIEEPREH